MKKKKSVLSDEIHWETAKHIHFRDFDKIYITVANKISLYALNQCYNMFCVVLIDCWCQAQM